MAIHDVRTLLAMENLDSDGSGYPMEPDVWLRAWSTKSIPTISLQAD